MNYANYIDHTLLKADATEKDIKKLCKEAKEYGFYSVCINPGYVRTAKKALKGSDVKVCTVIGFPLGANTTKTKIFETKRAVADGAEEVDVVINVGKLRDKKYSYVLKELTKVVNACNKKALVKVIIETCYLNKDEILKACELVYESGADFVKTSTGYGNNGAQLDDVVAMKEICNNRLKIKASGGIKTLAHVEQFILAGADRIGTSSGINIVTEAIQKENN
jgi:deoxyribose-phosphate aldolase